MESQNKKVKNLQDKSENKKFGHILRLVYKFRGVFMAIPVVACSAILATISVAKLPAKVMINIPALAERELIVKLLEVDKGTAVILPVLITAVCLLMMFCSRRQLYPWLISLFSLILPLILLFAGMFPG